MKIKQIKQESITKKTSFDKCLLINVGAKPNQKKLNDLKTKYVIPIQNMKNTYLAIKNPIVYETQLMNYMFLEASNYTENVDLANYIETEDTNIDLVVQDKLNNAYKAYVKRQIQTEEYVDTVDTTKYEEEVIRVTETEAEQMEEEIKEVEKLVETVQEIEEHEISQSVIEPEPKPEPQAEELDMSKYPKPTHWSNGIPHYCISIEESIRTKLKGFPPNAKIAVTYSEKDR